MATAGRTVLCSAIVICASLSALLVFPQRFLYSMGIGGALVALAAGVAALVVLPAVLALLGERVNALSPARLSGPPPRCPAGGERRLVPPLASWSCAGPRSSPPSARRS